MGDQGVYVLERYHVPGRGSDVEAWVRRWRGLCAPGSPAYYLLDDMLDEYRLLADTGRPLITHDEAEAADEQDPDQGSSDPGSSDMRGPGGPGLDCGGLSYPGREDLGTDVAGRGE